jgi:galactose mutarotase-like enzyme
MVATFGCSNEMAATLEHIQVGEMPAIALANEALRVVVVPQVGGKIISLTLRGTGREWLWTNPDVPLRQPPANASNFAEFDCGGWDEIFPSVNACHLPNTAWGDREITDHGELWQRPWQTLTAEVSNGGTASLALAVSDPLLPFRFARTLTLASGASPLVVDYELSNLGDRPLPYLWAAHPLLAICPGDSIHLPPGTLTGMTGSFGRDVDSNALPFAWPQMRLRSGQMVDFSVVPDQSAGIAAKLFAENVPTGCIEVRDETGRESIKITFDPNSVPHVGLWLNYCGWSGAGPKALFNAGIEPTTSPYDDLAIALNDENAARIEIGMSRNWSLVVRCADMSS